MSAAELIDDLNNIDNAIIDNDLMIDIETLGTQSDAAILSIGAVFFNTKTLEFGEKIHIRVNIKSSITYGSIDPETVMWWLKQDKDTQDETIKGEFDLLGALCHLSDWINALSNTKTLNVWAKSPSFDLVILNNAYKRFQKSAPWHYYNERDVRTAIDFGETHLDTPTDHRKQFEGKHTALQDALFQASLILNIYDQD